MYIELVPAEAILRYVCVCVCVCACVCERGGWGGGGVNSEGEALGFTLKFSASEIAITGWFWRC